MTHDEIKQRAIEATDAVLTGKSVEGNKIELKRQWYDLRDPDDEYEYSKDVSAIVNTPGDTGMIIFGVDEMERKIYPTHLCDQNLDSADLHNKIVKWIERPFNVELIEIDYHGTPISILAIPPTNTKPHFLTLPKNFQLQGKPSQAVYIRKSSKNVLASREDLDLMLWDNRSVIPEYALKAFTNNLIFSKLGDRSDSGTRAQASVVLENLGSRPVSISNLVLHYAYDSREFSMHYNHHYAYRQVGSKLYDEPGIIPVGHMLALNSCDFHGNHGMHFSEERALRQLKMSDFKLDIMMTSGVMMTIGLHCQHQEIIESVIR